MTAPHAQAPVTVRVFSQRLSATRRAARLARRLTIHQLDAWGVPYGSDASDTAALIVAELAANAVLHGRVPGRDIALRLTHSPGTIRIEIADPRGERLPRLPTSPVPDAETGRGLILIDALASRWGVDTEPGPGKRVWAEIDRGIGSHARSATHRAVSVPPATLLP
ncbi:ATP-binding protein [Streptomyces sp. TP-A0356]|uniref:ATP-binding protein n=1 Tax=Streptomyces sp. TP-A0356 TaxID=1359208 RepID=UPI0006E17360|nr:ATP-binding protein [Streptomyces sp. TP-A0356]